MDYNDKIRNDPYINRRLKYMTHNLSEQFNKNHADKKLSLRKKQIESIVETARYQKINPEENIQNIEKLNSEIKLNSNDLIANQEEMIKIANQMEKVFSCVIPLEYNQIESIYNTICTCIAVKLTEASENIIILIENPYFFVK